MSRFNLIDEPWIPVRFPDGSRKELGINETLRRAKEIAAIEDPSPLVVAALHRFLLAVLYRALEGPTDINQAKALFRSGLPFEKIEAYLEKWRGRFWLFDEEYPFGQVPGFHPKIWRAWTALAAEHNADNAKVLFDHVDVQNSGSIPEASTVKWMLATQTFSVSSGKSELSHTGTAPSATGIMVLPLGQSLQDTLIFCLVPENREVLADDLPLWERIPESIPFLSNDPSRVLNGTVDRYTWRSRSILLQGYQSGGVEKLAFASGLKNPPTEHRDPMVPYQPRKESGVFPMPLKERGLWRDFDSLLPDQSKLAPQVVEHATALTRNDQKRFPLSVLVLAQANDKAKIESWKMERFTLPKALLGEKSIRGEIRGLLEKAEDAQKALWSAMRVFARNTLSRGDRDPAAKDVSEFVSQLPCTSRFWSSLEAQFHEVLQSYTLERHPYAIEFDWLMVLRSTMKEAWGLLSASVSTGDAWTIRALVKAESHINRKIEELDAEIKKFESSLVKEEL